jgi:branched-chain amino acid transport system ATP-binding protein
LNNLLEVRDITVFYKDFQAIYPLSLAVTEGSIVSIIGSNGAGKATLMKAICGLKQIRSGEVFFKGETSQKSLLTRLPAWGS